MVKWAVAIDGVVVSGTVNNGMTPSSQGRHK